MRLRRHRRTMVVWSSSSGRTARYGVQEMTRSARPGRIRGWLRTGALLTIIGVMRLARTARTHLRPTITLAGLAMVNGVGETKLARYGQQILDILTDGT